MSEQEIKELKKIIRKSIKACNSLTKCKHPNRHCGNCLIQMYAESIYIAGYRKEPKEEQK